MRGVFLFLLANEIHPLYEQSAQQFNVFLYLIMPIEQRDQMVHLLVYLWIMVIKLLNRLLYVAHNEYVRNAFSNQIKSKWI